MGCNQGKQATTKPTKDRHEELAFGGEEFQNKGVWDPDNKAAFDKGQENKAKGKEPPTGTQLRQIYSYIVPNAEVTAKFDEMVEVETLSEIGGPSFHEGAAVTRALVHRVKGKPTAGQKCLIYYHGGGFVAGSPEHHKGLVNRYAVECDATIVSVTYRLAPENKFPDPVYDSYANLKWVVSNAESLGIDKDRIAIFGESAGGYIVAAVAVLLADRNESDLVKFQFPQMAVTGDMYLREDWSSFSEVEEASGRALKANQLNLCDDFSANDENPLLFPNKASAEQFSKMPRAVCLTTEFDVCRRMTVDFAESCKAHGRLLELGVLNGCMHTHFMFFFTHETADQWFKACGRVAQLYL